MILNINYRVDKIHNNNKNKINLKQYNQKKITIAHQIQEKINNNKLNKV